MIDTPVQIQFALISHTNNGKTTLARTLIGADVGEIRDAAHVTILSEAHTLLTTPIGDVLQLWDTPGFGDSVRLLKRLGLAGNPIGWFLREVFDRYRDRPLWLSQQAMRTAKDSADVVLYLVNASENPQDAGYLSAEMKILEWLGKPVAVLLNQMGAPRPAAEEQAELAHWCRHLGQYPIVKEVLALDAFARSWVQERLFYEAVGKLLPDEKAAGYARLRMAWETNNAARFQASVHLLAEHLVAAAKDRQALEVGDKALIKSALNAVGIGRQGSARHQDKAMRFLVERLEADIGITTARLLELHKIDPSEVAQINARVRENFVIQAPLDKTQAGLLGAVISGATTGLSADLMAGGLTFGAGLLLGSVVGALSFAGAAWGFNITTHRNQPYMQFTDAFLRELVVTSVLRYLAVIHFGRGRGNFVESEAPAFWQDEVKLAFSDNEQECSRLWSSIRTDQDAEQGIAQARKIVMNIISRTLTQLYPGYRVL